MSNDSTIEMIKSGDTLSLVSKWQKQMTQEKIDQAQRILDAFEVDVYSMTDPLPNSKYLINSQN